MSVCLRDDASELLNVVKEDGSFFTTDAGEILTVARGIAHTYGIWHQTTNVLLVSPHSSPGEVNVFLQKRSPKKRLFPGAWTVSCGGHMGRAIDPLKSALREATEELGLSLDSGHLIPLHSGNAGFPNMLKVWRYDRKTILQMGREVECFGYAPASVDREVMEYIETTGLDDFPAQDAPVGLELEAFNREFCFYYLYFPTEKQVESPEFRDKEAVGLKEVLLQDFLAGHRHERTDSSETLITHCVSIEQLIHQNLAKENVQ